MTHTLKDFQHQLSFLLLLRSVGLRQLFGFAVCFDQSQQVDYIPKIKEIRVFLLLLEETLKKEKH